VLEHGVGARMWAVSAFVIRRVQLAIDSVWVLIALLVQVYSSLTVEL